MIASMALNMESFMRMGDIRPDHFAPVLLNLGPNTRGALSFAHPALAGDDSGIVTGLFERYTSSAQDLLSDIRNVIVIYGPPFVERTEEIFTWLLQSRIYGDLARSVQENLLLIKDEAQHERSLVAWRGLDGASAAAADMAQQRLPPGMVATPYALVEQEESHQAEHDRLVKALEGGETVSVTRVVFSHGNRFQWSPFWTPGSIDFDPTTDSSALSAYLREKGIPEENSRGKVLVAVGRLVPGSTFIIRSAPGIGNNTGGGVEIVTTFDGVEIMATDTVKEFVKTVRSLSPTAE